MRTRSQRLLSMVLALSMLLTFLPLSAFADDGSTSAAENIYTYNVSGEGTYTYTLNDDDNTATLTEFTGTAADVPKTVTKGTETYYKVTTIGEYAFANRDHTFNTTLQSVFLPDSIQTIKEYAFHGCSSLSNITLYEGLTEVEIFAFFSTSLETINWPKSLTIVGAMAFHNMTDFSQGNSAKPIKTIIYHGTKAQWDEMARTLDFVNTNPQLLDATLHYTPTVTFDVGEHGTAPEDQVVPYEGYAEKPRDPEKKGYTFQGWYTKSEDGEEKAFNFGTKITEDTKLFAHW